ncbi:MAG TPA: hypothetical protein VKP88_07285 [Candidatus Paceibacterota bacterium]|nr:hypothetical protein [Candidatus Paceibacterota bacterium]
MPTSSLALPFFTEATASTVFLVLYIFLCLVFVGHWLVASYHWHTFGSERKISNLSITIYGVGGLLLLGTMGLLLFAL